MVQGLDMAKLGRSVADDRKANNRLELLLRLSS